MRLTILLAFLAFAIACGGDAVGPANAADPEPPQVDPEPPQFEAIGDFHLYAVGDTAVGFDAVSTVGTEGCAHPRWASPNMQCAFASYYIENNVGWYTLFVGPGGVLSLYADSTYWLRYTETMVIGGPDWNYHGTGMVDLEGRWTATGVMYDSLSFTVDRLHREIQYFSGPYRQYLDMLRGILREESARRTTTTGAVLITPLYVDLYLNQPFASDTVWDDEHDAFWSIDNSFKLTFYRP